MTVWRANMLGSPGEGMGYFLRHPLSADDAARARESRRLLAIGKYHERYVYQVRPASRGYLDGVPFSRLCTPGPVPLWPLWRPYTLYRSRKTVKVAPARLPDRATVPATRVARRGPCHGRSALQPGRPPPCGASSLLAGGRSGCAGSAGRRRAVRTGSGGYG